MRTKVKIEHIAMYVNDLEATKEFFIRYLNAESSERYHNIKTEFYSYFLSFEDGAGLEIMNKPKIIDNEKNLSQTGYIHIAFSVGSKENVDMLTQQLK